MAEIIMPKMGDAMTEGKVLRWYKKAGDAALEPSGEKAARIMEAENGHERPKRRRGERAAAKAQVD